jgi:hypothetical protein
MVDLSHMDIIARLLTLVAWAGAAVLLLLLYRIAYFYEISARQPTHYRLFLVPLALFLVGGLRFALIGQVAGDVLGDGLLLIGGLVLTLLGMNLLRKMTGGRR